MRPARTIRLVCFLLVFLLVAASSGAASLPDFADLAENAGKAVVNVSTSQKAKPSPRAERKAPKNAPRDPFEEFFDQFERRFGGPGERGQRAPQRSLGSGFIISADGYVVTNNHVVEDADEIKVNLQDMNKPLSAKLVGRDSETDLALLKIEAGRSLPFLRFGDSEKLKIGQWVVAIGNPFGLDHSVTAGIISAKSRVIGAGPFDDFLQTDASINPGNSGGPLLNLDGEVVGINTAIVATGQGIGFAIPSNLARGVIEQLRTGKKISRGWLGVSIQDLDEQTAKALGLTEDKGALVAGVSPGEPAAKAGVQPGDVITEIDGQPVDDSASLLRRIASTPPGHKIVLTVIRKGKVQKITAMLGERDEKKIAAGERDQREGEEISIGVALRPVSPAEAKRLKLDPPRGLVVVEVEPGSPADQGGLRRGDVIVQANQRPVGDVTELTAILEESLDRGVVVLLVKRKGQTLFRTIPLAGED